MCRMPGFPVFFRLSLFSHRFTSTFQDIVFLSIACLHVGVFQHFLIFAVGVACSADLDFFPPTLAFDLRGRAHAAISYSVATAKSMAAS